MYSNQKLLIAITALIFTTTAIQAFSKETERHLAIDPPETVDYVDIDRYLGRWYQQAVIPDFFERNCVNTQTFYSRINSTSIQVDNTCQRDGRKVESLGNNMRYVCLIFLFVYMYLNFNKLGEQLAILKYISLELLKGIFLVITLVSIFYISAINFYRETAMELKLKIKSSTK